MVPPIRSNGPRQLMRTPHMFLRHSCERGAGLAVRGQTSHGIRGALHLRFQEKANNTMPTWRLRVSGRAPCLVGCEGWCGGGGAMSRRGGGPPSAMLPFALGWARACRAGCRLTSSRPGRCNLDHGLRCGGGSKRGSAVARNRAVQRVSALSEGGLSVGGSRLLPCIVAGSAAERLVGFASDPQAVEEQGERACHRYGSLLLRLASAAGAADVVQAPATAARCRVRMVRGCSGLPGPGGGGAVRCPPW